MSYTPLWCKSNYSFLDGASHPDELVEEAHHLGIRALAITDRDGVYGIVRAHVKAVELGVKLIIGAQVTIADLAPPSPGIDPALQPSSSSLAPTAPELEPPPQPSSSLQRLSPRARA